MSTLAFIKRKLPEAEAAALVNRAQGIDRPVRYRSFDRHVVWMTLEEYKRRISIGGLAQVVHEEGVLIHGGVE
jgi:hypothetical protein